MFRSILILGLGSLLLAACASSPSSLQDDDLFTSVTASPAPAPIDDESDDGLPAPMAEETGPPAPSGRGESGSGRGGGGMGEGAIGIGSFGSTGSGGGESAAGSGFVYPAMGSAFAATRPESPYVMQASGEGPYWRSNAEFYELDGDVLARFSLIAADLGELGVTLRPSPIHLENGFRSYVSAEAGGPRVSANYQAGPCVDGMGVEREFFASIQVDGTTFEGCARETGGQWDWSRDLLIRYAQIMLCLDEVEGASAAIDAYSPTGNNTAVRVLGPDGSRFECLIVNETQRLASVRELDVTEVHLNEGRTLFVREPFPDPEQCRSFESIMNRSGEVMGYLAHDRCQNPRVHVEGPLEPGES